MTDLTLFDSSTLMCLQYDIINTLFHNVTGGELLVIIDRVAR